MEDTDKVVQLFSIFSNLELENQEVFMERLECLSNPEILKAAVATPNTLTVSLNELLKVNKANFISECDPRLKAFLAGATERKKKGSKQDISALSNASEAWCL